MRPLLCLKIFDWHAPTGKTIYCAAKFEISGLEDFGNRQTSFDIFFEFGCILKFFLRDYGFFPGFRIPAYDFIVAYINPRWLILHVSLELRYKGR